jgi:hypothetical protein
LREYRAKPAVAADGAGTTAFRGMTSFQPAPLLNLVVSLVGIHGGQWGPVEPGILARNVLTGVDRCIRCLRNERRHGLWRN